MQFSMDIMSTLHIHSHYMGYSTLIWRYSEENNTLGCIHLFYVVKVNRMDTLYRKICLNTSYEWSYGHVNHVYKNSPPSDNYNAFMYNESILVTIGGYVDTPGGVPDYSGKRGAIMSLYNAPLDGSLDLNPRGLKLIKRKIVTERGMHAHTTDNMMRYFDSHTHISVLPSTETAVRLYSNKTAQTHVDFLLYARYNKDRGWRQSQLGKGMITFTNNIEINTPSTYKAAHVYMKRGGEFVESKTVYTLSVYTISTDNDTFAIATSPITDGVKRIPNNVAISNGCSLISFVSIDYVNFFEVNILSESDCVWSVKNPSKESVKALGREYDVRTYDYPASGIIYNSTHVLFWLVKKINTLGSAVKPVMLSTKEYMNVANELRMNAVSELQI